MFLRRPSSADPKGSKFNATEARLERALEAREEAERQLAEASLAKAELAARIAELEGSQAAREHAGRARELDTAHAQLHAERERAAHEQNVMRDVITNHEQDAELLRFKLRQAEHASAEHGSQASRLLGELEAVRLELAEERKLRYFSEDRQQLAVAEAERDVEGRTKLAEARRLAAEAEAQARAKEVGQMRGAIETAVAERDALRTEQADAAAARVASEAALAQARAALDLVRVALKGGVAGAAEESTTGEDGDGSAADGESLSELAHQLRRQALGGIASEDRAAASDRGARDALAALEAAQARTAAAEEELVQLRQLQQETHAQLATATREAAVPVLGASAELAERDETINELTRHTVPQLEQRLAEAKAGWQRAETKATAERQAKTEARAAAAAAREAASIAREEVSIATAATAAAEVARDTAASELRAAQDRCLKLQAELQSMHQTAAVHDARVAEVVEQAGTSDVRSTLLEEQARLLRVSLTEEEAKVSARDEMLRSLQQELAAQRQRAAEHDQKLALAQHGAMKAKAAQRDADAERAELEEKLTLAMMEVNARAERLEHAHSQVGASRGELRALENQLVIASNRLASAQQENTAMAQTDASRAAQLNSAVSSLRDRTARLEAAEKALAEERAEGTERRAEMARLAERVGVAAEERDLLETQLQAARGRCDLLQAEIGLRSAAERAAKTSARDEQLLRVAHEGRNAPLRAALAQQEADLEEAAEKHAGRVLLVERLHTAEAQRAAAVEQAGAAERRAAAAELGARNATERLEMIRGELTRREARISAMRASLSASEEELALLRASKELLAARHELQAELNRQRALVVDEGMAVQRAVAEVKTRQLDARDNLVKAAGQHAAAALSAVRTVEAQAAAADQAAETRWQERSGSGGSGGGGGGGGGEGHVQVRTSSAASELEGRLKAARLEVEASSSRAEKLRTDLSQAVATAAEQERLVAETRDLSFHNHCLLVKLLLNTRKSPENVLTQELYAEMTAKEVPIREWPSWVMVRMSGGEPLSAWL